MAKKTRPAAATMPSLHYLGPNTGFEHGGREFLLVRGRSYSDLPADHHVIVNLQARGLLVPVPAEPDEVDANEAQPFTGDEF